MAIRMTLTGADVLTVLELEVLLWYATREGDCHYLQQPIWPTTRDRMLSRQLLEWTGDEDTTSGQMLRLAPRGRAFVDALLQVPLPEQRWVVRWPSAPI